MQGDPRTAAPPLPEAVREQMVRRFTEILSPAIDARAPYAKVMIGLLVDEAEAAAQQERARLEKLIAYWRAKITQFGPGRGDAYYRGVRQCADDLEAELSIVVASDPPPTPEEP